MKRRRTEKLPHWVAWVVCGLLSAVILVTAAMATPLALEVCWSHRLSTWWLLVSLLMVATCWAANRLLVQTIEETW